MGQVLGQQERAADPQALVIPVWSPEAIHDFAALRSYIEQDNPAAAQRVVGRIIENVEALLPDNPDMGRHGRVPQTKAGREPGVRHLCRHTRWLRQVKSSPQQIIA